MTVSGSAVTAAGPIDWNAAQRAYTEDGATCLRGVFSDEWLELLREGTELALRCPGAHADDFTKPGQPGRYFGDLNLWQRLEPFRRFVFESPAARIAGRLMGASRVNFFYDQLLVKEPGTRERTPWHQDQPYWAISGRQVCSIWLPLDPVGRDTCVEYVAGSHRWDRAFNPKHFVDGSPYRDTGLEELPDIEAGRSRYRILAWDLSPGDCLVFQAMIVHGAPGNASLARRRRALATRWAGDDARYAPRAGETAIPTSDPGLAPGSVLDCPSFPLIWSEERA
jgi:ectoine hydroxylase-related dioxygenase (phytanoyl-CoA dioxygenase family)